MGGERELEYYWCYLLVKRGWLRKICKEIKIEVECGKLVVLGFCTCAASPALHNQGLRA